MTQHNIARSEAFDTRPAFVVTEIPRRRRPLHPAVKLYAIAAAIGGLAATIDHTTGGSIALVIAAGGFVAWRFWPTR